MSTTGWASIVDRSRAAYVRRVAGSEGAAWWTAVVVTAGSASQAETYMSAMRSRLAEGRIPRAVTYLAVEDPGGERVGTGGATLNALRELASRTLRGAVAQSLAEWWSGQRVLLIHAGGDSRRLPQWPLGGKLFSTLPVKTPWGHASTVFDEILTLSTAWAAEMEAGLLVTSGDVVAVFDAPAADWRRPGISAVAMLQPAAAAPQHGVYVADEAGRVYAFLSKPSPDQVKAAGGMLADGQVALDTGLLRFDAQAAARLTEVAGVRSNWGVWEVGPGILASAAGAPPAIDLYRHMTMALTGQWQPAENAPPVFRQLVNALSGIPFSCSVVEGSFHHVNSARFFRAALAGEAGFNSMYNPQDRLDAAGAAVVDSVLPPASEVARGAMVIECHLKAPLAASAGAIVHGVCGVEEALRIPEDTVVHQLPVSLPDGRRGYVVRVYGIEDDPRSDLAQTTWFGRPILKALEELGLHAEAVWEGVPAAQRTLWNARLFVFGSLPETWRCARWLMGSRESLSPDEWARMTRLSLAESAERADAQAVAEERWLRMQALWQAAAVALATSGADVRPLLVQPPAARAVTEVGRELSALAAGCEAAQPTEAASRHFQASLFFARGGHVAEAGQARAAGFACVRAAVDSGAYEDPFAAAGGEWKLEGAAVSAPVRIDMGGGWSDTPPFCLDWGGTVLNIAVLPKLQRPIAAALARLDAPVVRCISEDTGQIAEFGSAEEMSAAWGAGSAYAIPLAAMEVTGIADRGGDLRRALERRGGGLEIRTRVALPLGSGLGTSSVLAATVLRALAEMMGIELSDAALSDQVMRLEQYMSTGGGWQDQAGGIYPGAKLISSGPGLRQRLRVQPLGWSEARQREFCSRFLLYYTGIRRMAKGLLAEVVGKYLARELAAVQVLHSIKTLAGEMGFAMCEGDWEYLGTLLDRHWNLNQVLDPHTTNAPIAAMLRRMRPYLAGAKLAGAGGGGFLMLLARGPAEAEELRLLLAEPSKEFPGELFDFAIAADALRVERAGGGRSRKSAVRRST